MSIALKYAIFALLATLVNIAGQDLSLAAYPGRHALICSVLVGTAAGLLVKYYLDKKYIFRFVPASIAHDSGVFALYTVMGLFTTALFWGFEFGFESVFHSKKMRYLGAVIGLALGYLLKYRLDKKFVFQLREVT